MAGIRGMVPLQAGLVAAAGEVRGALALGAVSWAARSAMRRGIADMSLRLGYGLNGFTDHRLADAVSVLSGLGYDGVALTLDHAHLDPIGPGLAGRVAKAASLFQRHGLDVVIETGGRYVLDPRHKHHPTFVSDEGRERRIALVSTALRIAPDLGARVVSCWSGVLPPTAAPSGGGSGSSRP